MEAYKKNPHLCVRAFHLLLGWVKFSSINYLLMEQLKRTVKGCCRTLMNRENDLKQTVKKENHNHPGTLESLCHFLNSCFLYSMAMNNP